MHNHDEISWGSLIQIHQMNLFISLTYWCCPRLISYAGFVLYVEYKIELSWVRDGVSYTITNIYFQNSCSYPCLPGVQKLYTYHTYWICGYAGFTCIDIYHKQFKPYYTHILVMYTTFIVIWWPSRLLIGRLLVDCHKDEREREKD